MINSPGAYVFKIVAMKLILNRKLEAGQPGLEFGGIELEFGKCSVRKNFTVGVHFRTIT